ncbi:ABC transporter substrate-binding protein [Paracoccus hibiscisoli]|uniref:ABC transporter substrate-binding protein n=1 Tax=Paracoccus hibiscisoli TaxID=2023261 RepID=UPI0026C1E189
MRALSPEGVLSVAPDLILAEEGAGPPDAIALLAQAGIPLRSLPEGFGDAADALPAKITAIAEALGVPDAATPLLAALEADLARLAAARAGIDRPRRMMFILSAQGGRIMRRGPTRRPMR